MTSQPASTTEANPTTPPTDPIAPSAAANLETLPLPTGWLACQWCGIGVAPADQGRGRTVTASQRENGVPSPPIGFSFTTCPACEVICHRAEDLVSTHPRLAARIGSDSIAVYRVTAALMALDAAALVAPTVGADAELADLLALVPSGAAALWSGAFGPVLMSDARPNVGWTERWGHLARDRERWLAQAREQFGTVLRARADRARGLVEVREPRGRGCLFCGVGSVRVSAASAREGVWTLHTVSQDALGGRGPEEVSGSLCPACEDSVEWVGTAGPTAMERALRAACGLSGVSLDNGPTLSGLVGWGALARRTRPNREPWAHIEITEDLL